MLHVYQLICAFVAVLVTMVVLRSRKASDQVMGALVLVPLLLRLFLIK